MWFRRVQPHGRLAPGQAVDVLDRSLLLLEMSPRLRSPRVFFYPGPSDVDDFSGAFVSGDFDVSGISLKH